MPAVTRYFRSDSHEINGLAGKKLGAAQSSVVNYLDAAVEFINNQYVDVDVIVRHADGSETVLGSAVARVTRSTLGEGYQSAEWSCPETNLLSTDALKIILRVTTDLGSRYAAFITEQLGATRLYAAIWTFIYYTRLGWQGENINMEVYFGDPTRDTRIENFSFSAGTVYELLGEVAFSLAPETATVHHGIAPIVNNELTTSCDVTTRAGTVDTVTTKLYRLGGYWGSASDIEANGELISAYQGNHQQQVLQDAHAAGLPRYYACVRAFADGQKIAGTSGPYQAKHNIVPSTETILPGNYVGYEIDMRGWAHWGAGWTLDSSGARKVVRQIDTAYGCFYGSTWVALNKNKDFDFSCKMRVSAVTGPVDAGLVVYPNEALYARLLFNGNPVGIINQWHGTTGSTTLQAGNYENTEVWFRFKYTASSNRVAAYRRIIGSDTDWVLMGESDSWPKDDRPHPIIHWGNWNGNSKLEVWDIYLIEGSTDVFSIEPGRNTGAHSELQERRDGNVAKAVGADTYGYWYLDTGITGSVRLPYITRPSGKMWTKVRVRAHEAYLSTLQIVRLQIEDGAGALIPDVDLPGNSTGFVVPESGKLDKNIIDLPPVYLIISPRLTLERDSDTTSSPHIMWAEVEWTNEPTRLAAGQIAAAVSALDAVIQPGVATTAVQSISAALSALDAVIAPGQCSLSPLEITTILEVLDGTILSPATLGAARLSVAVETLDAVIQPGVATTAVQSISAALSALDGTLAAGAAVQSTAPMSANIVVLDGILETFKRIYASMISATLLVNDGLAAFANLPDKPAYIYVCPREVRFICPREGRLIMKE